MLPAPEDVTEHVRVPKVAQVVATRLRKSIVRGEIKEGEFLQPETVLTARFGVSRPTLREALRILESEGLIEIRRGSRGGATVRPPDGELAARQTGLLLEYRGATLSQVFDVAAVIESSCVRAVATNRTKADLAELTAALAREEATVEMADSLTAQNTFHAVLVQLSKNIALITVAEMVRHIIDTATRKVLEREGHSARQIDARKRSDRTHRLLIEHIKNLDVDAAVQLWDRHLRETSRYLQTALDSDAVLDLFD
jgi:GntR family transcriptional repressor for pyruvate dehydrogenase complex